MRLKPLAAILLTTAMTTQLAACGTIFYPERRGQISGELDSGLVVLNSLGFLLYIVPGVIAFAVDFATGAIYLPDGEYSLTPERLNDAVDQEGQVDPLKLKAIIKQDLDLDLPLEHAQLISHPNSQQLASLGLPPRA
ncbi:polyribonucleotide nucleotidyltransferase [Pseudomonas sp. NyZ704]|nr:polyribonucleotide nucleotidyltransferase [Pseudomonas sp. NyZ704]